MAWLNRIGIVLNFLAGFLLAPELIGLHRIQDWEVSLEQRAQKFVQVAQDPLSKSASFSGWISMVIFAPFGLSYRTYLRLVPLFALLTILLHILVFKFINTVWNSPLLSGAATFALFLLISLPSLLLWLIPSSAGNNDERDQSAQVSQIVDASLWTALWSSFPGELVTKSLEAIYVVRYSISRVTFSFDHLLESIRFLFFSSAAALANLLIRVLGEDERLRGYLVAVGITFFIAGNFIQLWATF